MPAYAARGVRPSTMLASDRLTMISSAAVLWWCKVYSISTVVAPRQTWRAKVEEDRGVIAGERVTRLPRHKLIWSRHSIATHFAENENAGVDEKSRQPPPLASLAGGRARCRNPVASCFPFIHQKTPPRHAVPKGRQVERLLLAFPGQAPS